MLFSSMQYAAFLVVVVALYWVLPRLVPGGAGGLGARRARQGLLLVTSYLFYATWDWRFCFLLGAVTAVNYAVGRELGKTDDRGRRKQLLGVAIASTIGTLAVFKYFGFFVDSFAGLLRTFGVQSDLTLAILLPLGISFFTLHTLSYSIDVYRRELEPTDDPLVFAIFVAYFPQLLAGPLTRGKRMLPQFEFLPTSLERTTWQAGLELILIGLFQKVAIADALGPFTRQMFAGTGQGANRNFLMLVVAMGASVVQFVLDYAGYSNIARGSSKLLGIELPYNFRQPITRSRNFQDYWRRHNMTLMSWFRDYVLRPLRRRDDSKVRSSLLLVLIFTLSGLWHVASWGWIVWGLFIGCWVAGEIQVNRYRETDRARRAEAERVALAKAGAAVAVDVRRPEKTWVNQVGASFYVVAVLGFSMVLFRSPSLSTALSYYREVVSFAWTTLDWDNLLLFVYAVVAVIVVDHREHRIELAEGTVDPPTLPRAALWAAMIYLIIVFSGGVVTTFVYFQF